MLFSVTFEVYTEESLEVGDAESRGFLAEDITLREACELVYGCAPHPDSGPRPARVRWLSTESETDYRTGESEVRAIHIPASVTASSSRRIARMLGATV